MQPLINRGDPRLTRRDSNWLLLLGRLKPGVSLAQARAEITILVHQAIADFEGPKLSPDRLRDIRREPVPVEPGGKGFSWIRKHDLPLLFTLMGVVGLVLLIACANIANLLLTRATVRQKEISVRLAVGASRARLIRQLLTESGLLAAIGGVLGVLMAGWGSRILAHLASIGGTHPIPFDVNVHPNATVLTFAIAVTILTTIIFGLIPALHSTRVDLIPALKESAPTLSGGGRYLGNLLVIGQGAVSLLLLIGAGLFIRSFINLENKDIGYARARLVLLQIDPLASGYKTSQQIALMRSLIGHLRSIPGIQDATASENGLFAGDESYCSVRIEGFTPARKEDTSSGCDQIGPRYFQVLGVPILAGRDFNEQDDTREPLVAIINEAMARFYFGKRNPIGKYIVNGNDHYEIVGIVKDVKEGNLRGTTERRFYGPLLQTTDRINPFNFEIRTRIDPAYVIPSIRQEIQSFNRNLNVLSLTPVRMAIDESIRDQRMIAQLCGFFGILALLLAATGLYGVMAYSMSRRTNEIGVRMAMGATRISIISMVLREALILIAVGVVIGLPVALLAGHLIAAMLVSLSASDPIIVAIAVLTMLIAGSAAGILPAMRASRIDPIAALRQE
jgi:predicted permease